MFEHQRLGVPTEIRKEGLSLPVRESCYVLTSTLGTSLAWPVSRQASFFSYCHRAVDLCTLLCVFKDFAPGGSSLWHISTDLSSISPSSCHMDSYSQALLQHEHCSPRSDLLATNPYSLAFPRPVRPVHWSFRVATLAWMWTSGTGCLLRLGKEPFWQIIFKVGSRGVSGAHQGCYPNCRSYQELEGERSVGMWAPGVAMVPRNGAEHTYLNWKKQGDI